MANKTYLDKNGLTYFWSKIKSLVNTHTTPTGCISMFCGSVAPNGWLICDGSNVSRTTYADLFSIIGTTYGNGDGSTTFTLPDFKGRVPVGKDANDTDFDTLGNKGGSKFLQEHTHDGLRWNKAYGNTVGMVSGGSLTFALNYSTGGKNDMFYTEAAGTGDSENLQPYQVVNYIIKI